MKLFDSELRAAAMVGEALDQNDPPPLPAIPASVHEVAKKLRDRKQPSRVHVTVLWMISDKSGETIYSTSCTNLVYRESDIR